ncbi:cell surface glycoprotein CD200 receptor 1 isoform X1 [Molossus molossus]|uniref:cell surface glycoprotein CD200 receptor 1 isoform X1 n=1 Tax=Molossus molossus TaxID=27622 RepID=UPI001746C02A|nr:cell surface glycoprotein CD200 receptor 1 isoform X1 [Molossus molossus]
MPCFWRIDLQLLLMLAVFLVAECVSTGVEGLVTSSNSTQQMDKDKNSLGLQMDKEENSSKPLTEDVIVTLWKIILRNKPHCIRAHKRATHMTTKTNCTDERMTWPYRPDQNSVLQIDPVVITHDGYYECQVVTPDGNFHYGYHLQVLVVPEMTLFENNTRTAVCKAIAGRPAARISWTPEGDCVPEHNSWDNGTVTVQSTCHWADSNVSVVSCSISHETGNWSQSLDLNQVYSSLPVLVDTKAVLYCPTVPLTDVIVTLWKIILRNKPHCIRAHKRATHMTTKTNCTDERMTWPYGPDQNSVLQIDPVVITHDGYYECQVVTPDGNFHYGYHLQVLVVPEMTLFENKTRTAVCKAIAGRPAARISWTPEGDCVPEHNSWDNGTVTVQSTCHWAESNVSVVSCSISHETGNWSQSIDLNQGVRTFPVSRLLIILYVKSSLFLVILVVVGIICFQSRFLSKTCFPWPHPQRTVKS